MAYSTARAHGQKGAQNWRQDGQYYNGNLGSFSPRTAVSIYLFNYLHVAVRTVSSSHQDGGTVHRFGAAVCDVDEARVPVSTGSGERFVYSVVNTAYPTLPHRASDPRPRPRPRHDDYPNAASRRSMSSPHMSNHRPRHTPRSPCTRTNVRSLHTTHETTTCPRPQHCCAYRTRMHAIAAMRPPDAEPTTMCATGGSLPSTS